MAARKKKAPTERQSKTAVSGLAVRTANGSAEPVAARSLAVAPTAEEIRLRAYQLYLARGGVHGRDKDDWFIAEKLLRESRARSA